MKRQHTASLIIANKADIGHHGSIVFIAALKIGIKAEFNRESLIMHHICWQVDFNMICSFLQKPRCDSAVVHADHTHLHTNRNAAEK